MSNEEQEIRTGVMAAVLAYTLWGFFPIYFKIAEGVGPVEMLAHRIIWAVPFGAVILLLRHQWEDVKVAFSDWKKIRVLSIAAGFIALNWGFYVWAVQTERIFEASLGYYINPLVFVLAGVVLKGEILSRNQLAAVALALFGVSVLTVYGGTFPWVSFLLAFSFTAYGYIRKTVVIGAMPGLFIETVLLLAPACLYWGWLISSGSSAFVNDGNGMPLLLILAGPLTVLPLVFFAIAARRLQLSTLGFLQYIGPTLQFCVGLYYGEAFTMAHAICFGAIWAAVAVYSFDAWQKNRKPVLTPRPVTLTESLDDPVEGDKLVSAVENRSLNKDDA